MEDLSNDELPKHVIVVVQEKFVVMWSRVVSHVPTVVLMRSNVL